MRTRQPLAAHAPNQADGHERAPVGGQLAHALLAEGTDGVVGAQERLEPRQVRRRLGPRLLARGRGGGSAGTTNRAALVVRIGELLIVGCKLRLLGGHLGHHLLTPSFGRLPSSLLRGLGRLVLLRTAALEHLDAHLLQMGGARGGR